MKIEFLKEKDINNLSNLAKRIIYRTSYYSPLSKKEESKKFYPNNLKSKLKSKENLYLIAKERNKIIGFLSGHYDVDTFWLDWIGIDKKFRRRGISVQLYYRLERKLKKSKVHKIWGDSRTNNKESIPLLTKLKFKKITLIKKHWYKHDFYLWEKFI